MHMPQMGVYNATEGGLDDSRLHEHGARDVCLLVLLGVDCVLPVSQPRHRVVMTHLRKSSSTTVVSLTALPNCRNTHHSNTRNRHCSCSVTLCQHHKMPTTLMLPAPSKAATPTHPNAQ